MSFNFNKGISFIEVIIVISITIILALVITPSLSDFRREQSLKNTTESIISLLNEARLRTISSKNSTNYGVHFESDLVVLFSGSSYNQSDADNENLVIDSFVTIPTSGGINLSGGGSNVIFNRISGDTLQSGTIVIRLVSDASRQKIITINQTGLISSN